MKKIFKALLCMMFILTLSGCKDNAKMAVEKYLDRYTSLDKDVLKDMGSVIKDENITDEQKGVYEEIFKKQYSDLTYKIEKEEYNGDEATVEVTINVYDLYKVQKDASKYLANNTDDFNDENGEYSVSKYIDYKLKKMKEMSEKTQYTIEFYVVKTDGGWKVSSLSDTDLEKIHGVYNYES